MSLFDIKINDEELDVLKTGGPTLGPKLAKLIDEEIGSFDNWMQVQPTPQGGPLSRYEKAILKTYIYQKLVGRLEIQPFVS